MKFILLLTSLLVGFSTFAQQDDHSNFPEDAILILEGLDPVTRNECYLFIKSVDFPGGNTSAANMVVVAQTSFKHGRQAAPVFTLSQLSNRPQFLGGQNGRSQLAIEFLNSDLDFSTAQSYTLRWQHGNHFDNAKCIQLKEHKHN